MEKLKDAIVNEDCECKNNDCVRHGDCEACKESHANRGSLTHCQKEQ